MSDVVIGAWRQGLTKQLSADIATIEERYRQGFRQLPYESTVMDLVNILDAQEEVYDELLADCDCNACFEPPAPDGYEWSKDENDKVILVRQEKPKKK